MGQQRPRTALLNNESSITKITNAPNYRNIKIEMGVKVGEYNISNEASLSTKYTPQ